MDEESLVAPLTSTLSMYIGSYASWKVLEFPLSWACKVLEISVGSGKFWKFDVIALESC